MRKDPVHKYIEELKTNLQNNEITKNYNCFIGTTHRNSARYDFEYKLKDDLYIFFTIDYKGDFENDHEFILSFYMDDPTTKDSIMYHKKAMEMYVTHDTFPTAQIYALYLLFLEHIKQTFGNHHSFRLLWVTQDGLFIDKIEKEGFGELWKIHAK